MIAYLQPQSTKESVYPLTYRNDPRWRTLLIDTLTTDSAMMSEEEMLDLPVNLVVQDLIESLPLTQMGRSNFVEERCSAMRRLIAPYIRKNCVLTPVLIIWASAKKENALLVSRNHKDFPTDDPGIRMPYSV